MWTLWIKLALAAKAAPEPADIEIVVEEHRLSAAREAVADALHGMGYLRILKMGERSYYLTPKPWKPWVMLHDQGFVRVHGIRAFPVIGHTLPTSDYPGIQSSEPRIVPKGPTFIYQSHRAEQGQKDKVVRGVEPALVELRDAHWAVAKAERAVTLRAELVSIWLDGVGVHGESLPTLASRRDALVTRWSATADSEDGQWARDLIEEYVQTVVQNGEHPFAVGEVPFSLEP